jgi:hypothetical protein
MAWRSAPLRTVDDEKEKEKLLVEDSVVPRIHNAETKRRKMLP